MDCRPSASSVHGILQARILEWVAISFSRGSSRPRGRTQVSHIAGRRYWKDHKVWSGYSYVVGLMFISFFILTFVVFKFLTGIFITLENNYRVTCDHFVALHRYCIFCKLKVCSNPESSKSVSTILPMAFGHFESLCHIWVILERIQTFSLLLYSLQWSGMVIFDVITITYWKFGWWLAFFSNKVVSN